MVGSGLLLAARYGVARGLFTNEAGMGSAPLAAASARCSDPVRQALVASTATFWDTVVVCLITGLVIVSHFLAREPGLLTSGAALSGSDFTWRAFSAIPCLGLLSQLKISRPRKMAVTSIGILSTQSSFLKLHLQEIRTAAKQHCLTI